VSAGRRNATILDREMFRTVALETKEVKNSKKPS
jgi:hypothetical protein